MKVAIVLNRVQDTPLMSLLQKTCPVPSQLVITSFSAWDEFGWRKPKNLQVWLDKNDIESVKKNCNNVVVCRSTGEYKSLLSKFDICIACGREFFIFKPIAKSHIAVSGTRDYFSRLLDIIPHYSGALKIVLNGEPWINETDSGTFQMGTRENYIQDYNYINRNLDAFIFANPLKEYISILDKSGKKKIREELKIPQNEKVALVSFRRADSWHTIYKSDKEFYEASLETFRKLKEKGFFVVCRRRMGVDDRVNRRPRSSEIINFKDFENYIDLELSGWGSYPSEIFKACYASDLFVMTDTTLMCHKEAALCGIPTYMPFDLNRDFFQSQVKGWIPAIRDMLNCGIIVNKIPENDLKSKIKEHNNKWHEGDLQVFWKEALKNN